MADGMKKLNPKETETADGREKALDRFLGAAAGFSVAAVFGGMAGSIAGPAGTLAGVLGGGIAGAAAGGICGFDGLEKKLGKSSAVKRFFSSASRKRTAA